MNNTIEDYEKLIDYLYERNQDLHKAIYDYIGEPYQCENGKITPISQLELDKIIEIEGKKYRELLKLMIDTKKYYNPKRIIQDSEIEIIEDL